MERLTGIARLDTLITENLISEKEGRRISVIVRCEDRSRGGMLWGQEAMNVGSCLELEKSNDIDSCLKTPDVMQPCHPSN